MAAKEPSVEGPVSRELHKEGPPGPDRYFALDHVVLTTPSIVESLKWAKEAGFTAIEGGKHGDGLTENVLVRFKDGTYLEMISFVDPSPDEEAAAKHFWKYDIDGVCDWCLLPDGQTEHLATIGGEEAYALPKDGGRQTKDGKALKWRMQFPAVKSRGALPYFFEDLTPHEWRVPAEGLDHPNGAVGIKGMQMLSKPTRMSRLFSPLSAVLGKVAQEPMGTSSDKRPPQYPPRDRSLYLASPAEPKLARIEVNVRDAETEQEQGWVAKAGEGIYEVLIACEGRKELGDSLKGLSGLRLAPVD